MVKSEIWAALGSSTFTIGADTNNGGDTYVAFMNGVLDDLQIYDTVLTPNEIRFSVNNRGGARVSFDRFESVALVNI